MKKVLKVGIMSRQDFKKRTIAIAKGEYKPKQGEPKVYFESIQSMSQVLSEENQKLLYLIETKKPNSIKELGKLSGRKSSNLSRTLKKMDRYGIVRLDKETKNIKPVVLATDFKVEFGLKNISHIS